MIDVHQYISVRAHTPANFRRGAAEAEFASSMWPDPEAEERWQGRGRRMGNQLLTGALDLLDEGFCVLPLAPGGKKPRWGGASSGWMRSARYAVERWQEVPDANVGVVTGAKWGLVVVDLDGQEAFAWWTDFQQQHGTISTRAARSGRSDGGLHFYFRVPHEYRHCRLRGGNGLIAPHVDIKGDGGYVTAPPSLHESGATYQWVSREVIADVPPAILEWLLRSEHTTGARESSARVRDGRESSESRCLDHGSLLAKVEQVATTAYGRTALQEICRELAGCPEGGGPHGGRDNQAYWSYGRVGYLVGSGLLNPAEGLDALGEAMDANGLGQAMAKSHRFWDRVAEGIENPLVPETVDLPERAESGVESEHGARSMSDLSDKEFSRDLYTAKSDIAAGAGRGDLPPRASRTRPTVSPLAVRLWEEGTFCAILTRFAVSGRRLKKGPVPCGRMDCEPCQRRLLAAWAETAARWLQDHTDGVLQTMVIEPKAWSTFHKRLSRADAEYFKVPTPDGLDVLFWSIAIVPGAHVLAHLHEFEERLERAWWVNRSMDAGQRVDTSMGWQPPKKERQGDDWEHLGVASGAVAETIGRLFIPQGAVTSPPLEDGQLRSLQRCFPDADRRGVFGSGD